MAGVLHDAAIRKGRKRYVALVRGEWNPEINIYFKTNDNSNKDGDDRKNDCEEDSESPGSVVFVDKPLEVKGSRRTRSRNSRSSGPPGEKPRTIAARCSCASH